MQRLLSLDFYLLKRYFSWSFVTYNCGAAGILSDGTAAAEEGDNKDDTTNHDYRNGNRLGIHRITEGSKGANARHHNGTDHNQHYSTGL